MKTPKIESQKPFFYEREKLHKEFWQTKNDKILEKLVLTYESLVHKTTHQVKTKCTEPYSDLFQLGNIGLIKALRRFDPEHGTAFSSFAVPYIRGEMLRFLRDHGTGVKISRTWHELYSRACTLERGVKQLNHELQAANLGVSSEDLTKIKHACQVTRSATKELPVNLLSNSAIKFDYSQGHQHLEGVAKTLLPHIQNLPTRQKQILLQLYEQNLPATNVAQKSGVTPSQLKQEVNAVLEFLASIAYNSEAF